MASDLIVVFPLSIQKLYNFVRLSEKDIYNNCNKILANTTNNASSNDSKMKLYDNHSPLSLESRVERGLAPFIILGPRNS